VFFYVIRLLLKRCVLFGVSGLLFVLFKDKQEYTDAAVSRVHGRLTAASVYYKQEYTDAAFSRKERRF
jgi:hypothetical protein